MPLKVALQMDPIGSVNINADSTFRIAARGAGARAQALLLHPRPAGLRRRPGHGARLADRAAARVLATMSPYGPETEVDLGDFDVVWLRQDPPFDMGYITTTHLLDMIHPRTLVVNDPFWVRNSPEKLLVLRFPDLTPPTAIARDLATIRAFKARHGDIILKPLYGNGGAGVFRLDPNDRNLSALHELFTGINREPLIVQKFLPTWKRATSG
jgi:glutathione synthase